MDNDHFSQARESMLHFQLRRRGIRDERVLAAMGWVPRERFIPPEYVPHAYNDHPVPIGEGQTISQPYIVAAMIEHLHLSERDRVLEIGTGTGYQAAVLSRIVDEVFSIERLPNLAARARAIFDEIGISNVRVDVRDGTRGWPEFAPYDAIIVAAAAPEIPPPLVAQLADGGRMIIPVGAPDTQVLQLLERTGKNISTRKFETCRFVPLVSD